MARIEFSDLDTLKEWAEANCTSKNYEVFYEGEDIEPKSVIFAPTKSTAHLRYGVMKIVSLAECDKVKQFVTHMKLRSFTVGRYAWDASRP